MQCKQFNSGLFYCLNKKWRGQFVKKSKKLSDIVLIKKMEKTNK
jgi:hypothetical protein